jgi:hypothetical protein
MKQNMHSTYDTWYMKGLAVGSQSSKTLFSYDSLILLFCLFLMKKTMVKVKQFHKLVHK